MSLNNFNLILPLLGISFLSLFTSCNNGYYLQEYNNYNEFSKIENTRLMGWFPVELIKADAYNIKNVSYLGTKCVFGVFDYKDEERYKSIFKADHYIDNTYIKIFHSQIELVKDITPEWFPKSEYWRNKNNGIILFDNCYVIKDSKKKKIYYFHPEEESTIFNGKMYPGIRKTIR
ncbi:hypothetical protein [Mesonia sp. K7]|uniref:hypothetical protein n=1 Tax=Mesonia sp. K7 TaxID=2218606 RepID=UPI000DA76A66|nr:hypothetical protein [Mesonia sp. K7]PZD79273.1 hypothetical protein DNG35_01965 [Mesonia sp. K7]